MCIQITRNVNFLVEYRRTVFIKIERLFTFGREIDFKTLPTEETNHGNDSKDTYRKKRAMKMEKKTFPLYFHGCNTVGSNSWCAAAAQLFRKHMT